MSLKEKMIESSLKRKLGKPNRLTYPAHILRKDYQKAVDTYWDAVNHPEKYLELFIEFMKPNVDEFQKHTGCFDELKALESKEARELSKEKRRNWFFQILETEINGTQYKAKWRDWLFKKLIGE